MAMPIMRIVAKPQILMLRPHAPWTKRLTPLAEEAREVRYRSRPNRLQIIEAAKNGERDPEFLKGALITFER